MLLGSVPCRDVLLPAGFSDDDGADDGGDELTPAASPAAATGVADAPVSDDETETPAAGAAATPPPDQAAFKQVCSCGTADMNWTRHAWPGCQCLAALCRQSPCRRTSSPSLMALCREAPLLKLCLLIMLQAGGLGFAAAAVGASTLLLAALA